MPYTRLEGAGTRTRQLELQLLLRLLASYRKLLNAGSKMFLKLVYCRHEAF